MKNELKLSRRDTFIFHFPLSIFHLWTFCGRPMTAPTGAVYAAACEHAALRRDIDAASPYCLLPIAYPCFFGLW